MHLDFQIATGAQMTDALKGREGFEHAQRIGKTDALGTRRLRRFGDRRQEIRLAARSVLGANADAKPQIVCQTHMLADLRQQPPPIALQLRMQMLIRGRYRNVDQLWAQTRRERDVGAIHPAPDHQAGTESERRDRLNACALGVAHGRNADFQLGHAERIEAARDVDFLVETEGDTR
jgi:hypothetical protein